MKKNYFFLLCSIALFGIFLNSSAQSLVVDGSLYIPQDSVGLTYDSPSFGATDWIGIYRINDTPGGPESVAWENITATTGTLYLDAPQEAGTYIAYLFCCDSYDVLATSAEFSVGIPLLDTEYPVILENKPIKFTFKSAKFNDKDRIAIYNTGVTPGDANPPIDAKYIASSAGTTEFTTTLTAGTYDAYLLCCDGYDVITSCSFEVVAASVDFIIPKLEMFDPGATLYFSYNDSQYADGDWIGIFGEYDDPSVAPTVTWSKLVSSSGIISFPGVLPGGSYIAILFCCDGNTVEYTRSDAFEVDYGFFDTYVKTSSSVYPEYTSILVNYKIEDFNPTDLIGIYPQGVFPGAGQESLAWYYAPTDSGTIEFPSNLAVGDYVVYLICCDGYEVKTKYEFKIVDSNSPYIVASKISYAHGEDLEFIFNSSTYDAADWVGIYNAGEVPGGADVYSITWKYLPEASGTMMYSFPDDYGQNGADFTEPLPPGDYWAGLFCCDAYGLYALTNFTVGTYGVGTESLPGSAAGLSLFPNPTTGNVKVKVDNGENISSIKVYSLTGQVLYEENLLGLVSEKFLNLNLNQGVYLMEVMTENSKMSKKLIIQ